MKRRSSFPKSYDSQNATLYHMNCFWSHDNSFVVVECVYATWFYAHEKPMRMKHVVYCVEFHFVV